MENIVTTKRHRTSTAGHQLLLSATQSDRARLIYSAPFRRLQQKAQVFSLESNSAVRSRLTHSIEVSHIGRYIIAEICNRFEKVESEQKVFWKENSLALSNIVETACLMHDIGNPPFGHFGEAAISNWAKSETTKNILCKSLSVENSQSYDYFPLKDFEYFDGNPQGFRIITKLQGDDGFYGFNLTYVQLVAFLKYTHSPSSKLSNPDAPFSKKIGFFDTEKNIIVSAWNSLGIKHHNRHPLGFLMEASDDISYCISDIEDGIEKKIISEQHFIDYILTEIKEIDKENKIFHSLINILGSDKQDVISPFLRFKTRLSNYLVEWVADFFVENYDKFMNFRIDKEIISEGTIPHSLLTILKNYTKENLFNSMEVERIELSGFAIISGILEEYQKLLLLDKNIFLALINNDYKIIKDMNLHIHRRLFNRLPKRHLSAYKCAILEGTVADINKNNCNMDDVFISKYKLIEPSVEWNLRAHLIVDFISGMTDQFSMEFYQVLKGINVK